MKATLSAFAPEGSRAKIHTLHTLLRRHIASPKYMETMTGSPLPGLVLLCIYTYILSSWGLGDGELWRKSGGRLLEGGGGCQGPAAVGSVWAEAE